MIFMRKSAPKVTFKHLQTIEIPLKSHGGLAIFLTANDSILAFINCRFPGGYNNHSIRFDDFNQLHEHLLRETYSSGLFEEAQVVFMAGNMNLRLSQDVEKQFKFRNKIEEIYAE